MSSCSLHICSCSSLITFRTDCRKEEKGEKAPKVSQLSDPGFLTRAAQTEACRGGATGGQRSLQPSAFFTGTKGHDTFPEACPIFRLVLQFEPPTAPWGHPGMSTSEARSPATAETGTHMDRSTLYTRQCFTCQLPPKHAQVTHGTHHTQACYYVPNPKVSLTPSIPNLTPSPPTPTLTPL